MPQEPADIDVRKIAALARLELTPAEEKRFSRQLTDFLAYAAEIQQVDTTGVPPTSHPVTETPLWRTDDPQPSLDRDAVLSQAPGTSSRTGLFKVPKVL